MQIAVIARAHQSRNTCSELLCSLVSGTSSDGVASPGTFAVETMTALAGTLRQRGFLIEGPEPVAAVKLPDSHPLSARGWAALSRTMRRNAR